MIFADLDGFKEVNDKYGHQVGDQLLAAVATKLSAALRPGDRIGRLGGDEFLIFCPGVTDPLAVSAIARRLRKLWAKSSTFRGSLCMSSRAWGSRAGARSDGRRPDIEIGRARCTSPSRCVRRRSGNGEPIFRYIYDVE